MRKLQLTPDGNLICSKCKIEKPTTAFGKRKDCEIGLQGVCKECRNQKTLEGHARIREKNPNYFRDKHLQRYFGITFEQYMEMLNAQNGVCSICKQPEAEQKWLAVDHDHNCCDSDREICGNCIRGLLCSRCNTSIGKFNDDPDLLLDAAMYILSFRNVLEPL